MSIDKYQKGTKVVIKINKYSLADAPILGTVVKVKDWQNIYVRYYSSNSREEVTNPFFAVHIDVVDKMSCLQYASYYKRRLKEFYDEAVFLGHKKPNATPNKGQDESVEDPSQSE